MCAFNEIVFVDGCRQQALCPQDVSCAGLGACVCEAQAVALRQQGRILAAVSDQFVALRRRVVGGRAHQMGLNIDLVTRRQRGQASCSEGAVRVVGLVKIMQQMRLAAANPDFFSPFALAQQTLARQQPLAERRHQPTFERHQAHGVFHGLAARPEAVAETV